MKQIKKYAACFAAILLCLFPFCTQTVRAEAEYDCKAGRHKDVVSARVEPTQTQDGYETLECALCGRKYNAVLYATSHIWGPWIEDKAAACTEPGSRHRVCTRGATHTETQSVPATGHDYELSVSEPTCEQAGYNTYTCSRCGDTYTTRGADAPGHDYIESVSAQATCTEDGIKTFICSRNENESYTEIIPALGHAFGEWTAEAGGGREVRVCQKCGEREERAADAPEKPLFNTIDAVTCGIDVGLIGLFSALLIPCVRTVRRESRDYGEFMKRKKLEDAEAMKYDFN